MCPVLGQAHGQLRRSPCGTPARPPRLSWVSLVLWLQAASGGFRGWESVARTPPLAERGVTWSDQHRHCAWE